MNPPMRFVSARKAGGVKAPEPAHEAWIEFLMTHPDAGGKHDHDLFIGGWVARDGEVERKEEHGASRNLSSSSERGDSGTRGDSGDSGRVTEGISAKNVPDPSNQGVMENAGASQAVSAPGEAPQEKKFMTLSDGSEYLELVRRVVNKHDPEDLLKVGCPEDEYDSEIKAIAACLYPSISVNEAWLVVCNTLYWYFGQHDQPVLYWNKHKEIAAEIVAGLPECFAALPEKP